MRFSIIIPTIKREKELLMMLESLKNQLYKDFEVIIIDQNEEFFFDASISEYYEFFDLQHIKSEPLGASNARNIGIKHSKGDILTFPDDDCEYPDTFLKDISAYFDKYQIDGIVVSTKDREDGKPIALLAGKSKIITRINILKTVIEAGIFVKKYAINEHLFDVNMGVGSLSPYWSDEGPDFILKLLNDERKIVYCPQYKMYHPNPVKTYNEKTSIRSYRYGKGRGYFLKKK